MTTGEVIEKPPSKLSVIAEHAGGLTGMIFALVWITVLLVVTYVEPFTQDFFTDDWYGMGIFVAILPSIGDFFQYLWKMILGKVQIVYAIQSANEIISAIAIFILGLIYPFSFGEFDQFLVIILRIVPVIMLFTGFSSFYKFITWNDQNRKSLL